MVSNSSKMSPAPEIKLSGNSLGQRHRHFNSLVRQAFERGDSIESLPENAAVNKLFKIDLASKQRNIDYVLECLKSDDMLYVSRALKSKLLLDSEYEHIVTPSYLEDVLYPEMLTTAVTRMKHWIYINLRDPRKCQAFYEYYKEKNFEFAFKFLCKCSTEFILSEASKVLIKLTPRHLKILCEKSPHVARIYFDALQSNADLKALYLKNEKDFYNSVKCAIKSDAPLVLDIAEKYFRQYLFDKFSPIATRHIMKHHKDRFWEKAELYTIWFFDVNILAKCLNAEESKELVLRMARMSSLCGWFSYKSVEPLIKRLKPFDRAVFKKKVFVEKRIGEQLSEWPCSIPHFESSEYVGKSIFDENESRLADKVRMYYQSNWSFRKMLRKRKCGKFDCEIVSSCKPVTMLDQLFNEFRFSNFDKTLFELRKRIRKESSNQTRQYMMLVLVSKSGGREEALRSLLELLSQHGNEPSHLRATVIRSLTKRACIWRLSNNSWEQFLLFARGLGLDGNIAEAHCREGLHAVVIRSLLMDGKCEPKIQDAFLQDYSMLTDYKLSTIERKSVAEALPKIPLSAATIASDVVVAAEWIEKTIETLKTYKISVDTYPGLLETILDLAKKELDTMRGLLLSLFEAKIARRKLFEINFEIVQNDCSYVNALRHNIDILSVEKFLELDQVPERFLRSLVIYFNENDGLAARFLIALKEANPHKTFARPFAYLLKNELGSYLWKLDESKDKDLQQLSSAIRANAHLARPSLDLDKFGWRSAGTKLIANKILVCRPIDVERNIQKLLQDKQTARLAIKLAQRNNNEYKVFETVASMRPIVALKTALTYFRHQGDKADERVWNKVKPIIEKIDLSKPSLIHVRKNLKNVDSISSKIKPNYCGVVYKAFKGNKPCSYESIKILHEIDKLLPYVNEKFLENLLFTELLHFEVEKIKVIDLNDEVADLKASYVTFCRILIKFVLLSKDETIQKLKFEALVDPFLQSMNQIWTAGEHGFFSDCLEEIMEAVKYHTEFLDQTYVSRQPLLEKIVKWMQDILPREKYFDKYVHIHLSMLYFKALKQCLRQTPVVFADPKKKINEGVTMTGRVFGTFIAHELRELRTSYFESIVEIYASCLLSYIEEYTAYVNAEKFVVGIIKGILESTNGSESLLSLRLLRGNWYIISEKNRDELCEIIKTKDNIELQYFYNATVNNTIFH